MFRSNKEKYENMASLQRLHLMGNCEYFSTGKTVPRATKYCQASIVENLHFCIFLHTTGVILKALPADSVVHSMEGGRACAEKLEKADFHQDIPSICATNTNLREAFFMHVNSHKVASA